MWDLLKDVADKIFSEAGILAGVLFVYSVYLTMDNRTWRKENKELHEKVYNMGLKQIEVSVELDNVLDTLLDTTKAISEKLKGE